LTGLAAFAGALTGLAAFAGALTGLAANAFFETEADLLLLTLGISASFSFEGRTSACKGTAFGTVVVSGRCLRRPNHERGELLDAFMAGNSAQPKHAAT